MENNTKRPVIAIALNDKDKAKEKLAFWLIIFLWAITIPCYFILPQKIPMHINLKNEIDSWDNRSYIFMLPFIATLLYLLLGIISRYPQYFNYMEAVTQENAERLYTWGSKLIRNIKLAIVAGFSLVSFNVIAIARYPQFSINPISIAMQWLPVALIFGVTLSHFIKKKK
jgi:uncharacterized membrane protein